MNKRPPSIAITGVLVDELKDDELDSYPFGVIQLDRTGRILAYNRHEEQLARLRREDVIGKHFFFEVAPCTNVRTFYGRFRDGVRIGSLNAHFGFVFPFAHGTRSVDIVMKYRENDDSVFVLVRD